MLTIHRRDPSQNMARFYVVSPQADLLDGWSVVREWGRVGRAGRVRFDSLSSFRACLHRRWSPHITIGDSNRSQETTI